MARAFGLAVAGALLCLMAYAVGPVGFVVAWGMAITIFYVVGIVVSNDWRWPIDVAADVCRDIFGR